MTESIAPPNPPEETERFIGTRLKIVKLSERINGENPEQEDPSFEKQFGVKRIIKARSGEFEAVDVKPKQSKTDVPVLWASGMGATPDVNKHVIKKLYYGGREIISPDNSSRRSGESRQHEQFGGEL